jgi:hypothetical protein
MYHAYNRTRTYVIDKLWKKWFILQILVMLLRKGKTYVKILRLH